MTSDKYSLDNHIQRTPTHLLIIGHAYSKSTEDQKARDAIKMELIRRLKIFHRPIYFLIGLFANTFFLIDTCPIQEGPLEVENSDIPRGALLSIIAYLILFLIFGFIFYHYHSLYLLKYIAFCVVGIILYWTIRDFIKYLSR